MIRLSCSAISALALAAALPVQPVFAQVPAATPASQDAALTEFFSHYDADYIRLDDMTPAAEERAFAADQRR